MDHRAKLAAVVVRENFECFCFATLLERIVRCFEDYGRVGCRYVAGVGDDARVMEYLNTSVIAEAPWHEIKPHCRQGYKEVPGKTSRGA